MLRDRYPAPNAASATRDRGEPAAAPGAANPRTLAFARELRDAACRTTPATSARCSRWFHTEPFVYTLAPPLLGDDPVDVFLFETRRGFCEHYASAFVVLLRAAGIPARVVTGYQGGEINPRGGYMIVRQSDAHAWAEALVDGEWRRFDPTAAVSPSRIEMGLGGALPASEPVPLLARLDAAGSRALQLTWDAVNHDWRRHVIGFNYDRQRSLWRDGSSTALAAWQIPRWSRRSRWRGSALCSAGSPGGGAAQIAPARCGTRCARGSPAPACRACRTRAARLRRARRGALAAVRAAPSRDRRIVRGAALRADRRARRTTLERAAA